MKSAVLLLASLATPLLAQSPLTLWYRQPATQWVEALPVGNGRLGAMVFGDPARGRIQFNESTVWTGGGEFTPRLKSAHKDGAETQGEISGPVAKSAIRYDAKWFVARDGDGVALMLAAATNFVNYKDVSGDPEARVGAALRAASQK